MCQRGRYNLSTFAHMAESTLLPSFTEVTGLRAETPIPAYLRADAKLFFSNFLAWRRAPGGLASASAPAVASAAPVAPTPPVAPETPGVAPTAPAPAPAAAPAADAPATAPQETSSDCIKVMRQFAHHTTTTCLGFVLGIALASQRLTVGTVNNYWHRSMAQFFFGMWSDQFAALPGPNKPGIDCYVRDPCCGVAWSAGSRRLHPMEVGIPMWLWPDEVEPAVDGGLVWCLLVNSMRNAFTALSRYACIGAWLGSLVLVWGLRVCFLWR